MGKRTSLEIIAEILSLCRHPQSKTRLLYKGNLTWHVLNRYLGQMQSNGLLEIHYSPTKYLATQKGHVFLEKWKEIAEILMCTHEKLEDART